MHKILTIDASPKQLSKLRNGHAVRIKKGTGFNLLVHPETFHLVSRAFAKNKGMEVRLSPEELEMNRSLSPEQHMEMKKAQPEIAGQGIFGSKFDRMLKKAGIKKAAYRIGDQIKPGVKASVLAGLASGATALGTANPALIPYLPGGVAGLSGLAFDYLDNPEKYLSGISGIKGKPVKSMAEQFVKGKLNEKINQELGTNYDYMNRAGIENAMAQKALSELNNASVSSRFDEAPAPIGGVGLYAGGRIRTMDRSIMGRGNMNSSAYFPPALTSQPLSANFQMQHFLPPAYQKFNSGSGLYAGGGLYI